MWPTLHVGLLDYSKKNKSSFDIFPDERFFEGDALARSDLKMLPVAQSEQGSTFGRQLSGEEAWFAALLLEPTEKSLKFKRFGLVCLGAMAVTKSFGGRL